MKPQPIGYIHHIEKQNGLMCAPEINVFQVFRQPQSGLMLYQSQSHEDIVCPYQIGDVLWVRENIKCYRSWECHSSEPEHSFEYATDQTEITDWPDDFIPEPPYNSKNCYDETYDNYSMSCVYHNWVRPSIHMPKWACRLFLRITSVRAERVADISEEDAKAEGLKCLSKDNGVTWKYGIPDSDGEPGQDDYGWQWERWNTDPRQAFKNLWNSIYAEPRPIRYKGMIIAYESFRLDDAFTILSINDVPHRNYPNPWVWVLEFEPIARPHEWPEV